MEYRHVDAAHMRARLDKRREELEVQHYEHATAVELLKLTLEDTKAEPERKKIRDTIKAEKANMVALENAIKNVQTLLDKVPEEESKKGDVAESETGDGVVRSINRNPRKQRAKPVAKKG